MPIDYGAALRGGMAVVPDYAEAEAARAQLEQVTRANSLREQQMQQEAVQQQRAIEREANWNRDLQAYLANPTTVAARDLMLRYPDQAENMRKTLESTGTDAARSSLRSMGEIHALASRGDWAGAATLVERRIAADTAAGNPPDEHDAEMLSMLRSGDPVQQNRALGTLRVGIAAAAGPERFTEAMGRLDPTAQPTTMQQQYEYILRTAGPQAAANFLAKQSDRTQWVEGQGLVQLPDAPIPQDQPNANGPQPVSEAGAGAIMQAAADSGTISSADAERVRASLGANGTAAFNAWLQSTGVRVVDGGPNIPVVRTPEEARALPPGTRFRNEAGEEFIR